MPALTPTLLQPNDTKGATLVLARAFSNSPVYAAVLRGDTDADRERTLMRVKRGFVASVVRHGECRAVRDEDKIIGVTVIHAPGQYPLSFRDEIVQATGCATTGPVAIMRFLKISAYMRERHLKGPHYYLFAIAVDPAFQGRGIGKALLAELHERADARKMPCYLETEKPLNVKLYESVGYRVVTDEDLPGLPSGVRMWTMVRPAST